MIKRTLFFGNPAYLSTKNEQLVVAFPNGDQEGVNVPIEDIGVLVLENAQITVSNKLLEKLVYNNVAVFHCNSQHLPIGMLMPLSGHSEHSERLRYQLDASLPLKKNLWQQTVQAKIRNQAGHLTLREVPCKRMYGWTKEVMSGDSQNHEARAAAFYWQNIFPIPDFNRNRGGVPPNNLLNYGYAILRGLTARALVSSGMLPVLGIHHRNKYNAYCLADDIMEPYRPFVDTIVGDMVYEGRFFEELTTEVKRELLKLIVMDVEIDGKKSPLMNAMSRTTASLYACFSGESRKILYPDYVF
ncbi:MAG: type II CRISPR-associated endonuclease Cas1 [Cryomorphaceae bacterium]|nr:type II CRISPR-associated endonuclease Cas1 [Cryomorphaceae bacterium]